MANCKSCINGSDSEFHVNSGSGRVGSLYLWAGLGRVKQIEPTSSSAPLPLYESIRQLPGDRGWGNFQANISSPGGEGISISANPLHRSSPLPGLLYLSCHSSFYTTTPCLKQAVHFYVITSLNFNRFHRKFWYVAEIACCINIFHLTCPMSPPYLVKLRCFKLLHNVEMHYLLQTIWRLN